MGRAVMCERRPATAPAPGAADSADIQSLQRGQEVLFGKLDKQSGQLEAITASLHKLGAQAGPSVRDMLDIGSRVATAVVVIFAALAAGILHLAKGGNAEDLRKMTEKRH